MSIYYVVISALIFALITVVQLMRILKRWNVQIGPHTVPISVSWIALAVAGGMLIWGIMQLGR